MDGLGKALRYDRGGAGARSHGVSDNRADLAIPPATRERRPRVLLADDDALSRKLLGASLERSGFEVEMAVDGREALSQLEKSEADLLVLDFEMPHLDGAEVCRRLRASESDRLRGFPVIMLTAHVGEAEEIQCLQSGANDFVTKPVSREVLAARIMTQLRIRSLSDELHRQNDELARWRAAQEADLAAARATQRALIPAHVPAVSGWAVETLYRPLIQVGGDAFGWRQLDAERWLFWLADATGHGASAALLTALTAQLFHQAGAAEEQPNLILQAVNRELLNVFGGRSFMTACCALIEADGALTFCSAGHPPLLIRRADGAVEAIGAHTTMLGLLEGATPEQSRVELALADVAVLYTDGLCALKSPAGDRFAHDAARRALPVLAPGKDLIARLVEHLQALSDGEGPDDDLAVIALRRI